jgi:acyl carrier protein
VNWTLFKGIYEARGQRPLLEKIETPIKTNITPKTDKKSDILENLEAASESDRQSILIAYLQTEIAKVLGASQLPDPHRGFFDMGIDSLMAVDLKTRLETSLNCTLPATLLFESPTIKDLAEYIGKEVLKWNPPKADEPVNLQVEKQALAVSEIEQLSEDEVEASIAERLAQLESLMGTN